ncbi:MAG TPA: RsmB/NOP family class I SAM-dependent RNA methyltransferase [Aestuariivirgaceae bacterium]|nr:RsmB/NOP family class I SAM-dependent RNA methyltransferase [Aestuariivirgaceae bacterium]
MGGRASAAIEILEEILNRHRPAADALKDWGRAHRFAGSADRAAIGNLVFDALRKHSSFAHRMMNQAPRALVLAVLRFHWNLTIDALAELCAEDHGPGSLSDNERLRLNAEADEGAPPWIRGDYPEWLDRSLARTFFEARAEQGQAMAQRAPVDLRVNTLKTSPDKVLKALEKFHATPGRYAPGSIRLPSPTAAGRNPNVEAEPAHGKGWFEIQDEGSQIAALLSGAKASEQVADICAGSGGKTLALAAMMENKGQIHAYDTDRHRLRPIFERMQRAGARNIQVIPADEPQRLDALQAKIDLLLIDAPCSGSGSWRRKADAKWRLKPEALLQRLSDQRQLLDRGAKLLRPGGRLHYITCSLLPEENIDQVEDFLKRYPQFELLPYGDLWRMNLKSEPPPSADGSTKTLLLTPLDHSTDGFFIAQMLRRE